MITRIEVPASFRAMPRWWADGQHWLDALPDLVAEQCARWSLIIDGPVRHGSNALVVPVRQRGRRLVLRMSPPGDDVGVEAAALRFWAGRGTVQLVDVDHDQRAMIMERLDPGADLTQRPLAEALMIIGRLARRLAVPAPEDVPSTAAMVAAEVDRWPAANADLGWPLPDRLLAAAVEAGRAVIMNAPEETAVDGDLHFEQVLAGTREPWLVVDPVLLRGDLAYDFGRVMWSRVDELGGDEDIRDALIRLADAAEVGRDHARRWVLYRSASYLLWGLEHGLTIDPVRCRRLLDALSP